MGKHNKKKLSELSVRDWASLCLGFRKGSPVWFLARKFKLTPRQVWLCVNYYGIKRKQLEFDL